MRPFVLTICLLFLAVVNLFANSHYNDSLTAIVYKNAYNLIDKYELYSHFKSDSDYNKFQKLFRTKNCMIFNDIMPDNNLQQKVELQDYLKLAKKHYSKNVGISVIPYDKSSISFDRDDYGSLVVHAKKIIDLYSINGIHYIDTFNIRIEIFFNHYLNQYSITDIQSLEKNGNYLVIQPTINSLFRNRRINSDTLLSSTGQKYFVDSGGFTLIKDVYAAKEFVFIPQVNQVLFKKYKSPSYLNPFKKQNKLDKNIVPIKFNLFTSHIEFATDIGITKSSPVKLLNNKHRVNVHNKQSTSNRILISLMYRKSQTGNWQFKFGSGFDIFTYDLYLPKYQDSYYSIDADGDQYLRIIELNKLVESHSLTYITFPLIIQKGFAFNNNSISLSAGYYFMKNYNATYKSNAQALYSGYYDYLFNITISENGVYDFGYYELTKLPSKLNPVSLIHAYSIGIEYAYRLNRFTSLNAGLSHRSSINNLFVEKNSTLSKNNKDLKSISNINNAFQINYLSLLFGITVKL